METRWWGPSPENAPTLVFLHEGLGSVSRWRDFPARLAEATGCGALVYSRRGYGRSDPAALPRPVRFMHEEADVLERVLDAAQEVGLADRVHAQIADLSSWSPAAPLTAVVCAPAVLGDLTTAQRAHAIDVLQRATASGGIHLLHTADLVEARRVPIDELRVHYGGWDISVESFRGAPDTFLARKSLS
jgi:pimeloyl-ACP methyl ester carboxylesterase